MADYEGAVTGLIPCSVVLLTAADGDRRDAMTATTVFVAEEPPVLTMSVAKHILMHDLIETSREFVVNLASSEQASLAKKLGATHGRDVDKFAEFSLVSRPAGRPGRIPRICQRHVHEWPPASLPAKPARTMQD